MDEIEMSCLLGSRVNARDSKERESREGSAEIKRRERRFVYLNATD